MSHSPHSISALVIDDDLPSPEVTLDALRPNPRGPEPRQELVVLYNHGKAPVSLQGFRLGGTLATAQSLPGHSLAPHGMVVLVPPGFDPHHPEDEAGRL